VVCCSVARPKGGVPTAWIALEDAGFCAVVSLRLPTGELEVAGHLVARRSPLSHRGIFDGVSSRWGHETFHLMLKGAGTGELQRTDRRGIRQDVQRRCCWPIWRGVLSEPTQAALTEQSTSETQPLQVNRSNSYSCLKDQVLDLLISGYSSFHGD